MTKEVTITKEVTTKTIGKKKSPTKKNSRKIIRKSSTRKKVPSKTEVMEKILIENFVALQKVMTNLSTKFENLSNQISDLLYLFEESAKTVVQKDFASIDEKRDTKEIANKLDSLLDQNKLIARGLTLMHETAENPEIDYSIGSKTQPKVAVQPIETAQPLPPQPTNQKSLVREEPENKTFQSP